MPSLGPIMKNDDTPASNIIIMDVNEEKKAIRWMESHNTAEHRTGRGCAGRHAGRLESRQACRRLEAAADANFVN